VGKRNNPSRLIAVGTMAFYPKHPLVKKIIEWIKSNTVSIKDTTSSLDINETDIDNIELIKKI